MKKSLLPLQLLLISSFYLFSNFHVLAQQRTVSATIKGSNNKKIYLYTTDSQQNRTVLIDSTVSINDEFKFSQVLKELGFYRIRIDAVPGEIRFVWDNNINIKGDSQHIYDALVEGSPYTAEYINYEEQQVAPVREQIYKLSNAMRDPALTPDKREALEKQQNELIRELDLQSEKYIADHPQSFFSLFFLNSLRSSLGDDRTLQLLSSMSQDLQAHSISEAIREEIRLKAFVKVGKPAPKLEGKDFMGNQVSLAELKGKYVLLDFWGSWCGPCILLMPETKETYQRYKDKNVQFLGIAYDEERDRAKLTKLVEKFELPWPQVFQDKSDKVKSPIIQSFRVSAFPSIILLDPEGIIIYRGSGKEGLIEASKILDTKLK